MLKNIPRQRLLIYGLLFSFFPLLLLVFNFYERIKDLNQLENNISMLHHKMENYERKQMINQATIDHYRQADHFYIDKYLETLHFLKPEVENLQTIVNNPNFAFDDTVKKRLDHLTQKNRLVFVEGTVQSYPQFQETVETIVQSVEVDVEDLQEMLSRIEEICINSYNPPPNPPQLLILDFKIDRQRLFENNEIYNLHLKLLKREFF